MPGITTRCCSAECFRENDKPNEPCWGKVEIEDEIALGDLDWAWLHSCEGHRYTSFEFDENYKHEPPAPERTS